MFFPTSLPRSTQHLGNNCTSFLSPGPALVPVSAERPPPQDPSLRGGCIFLHPLNSESPRFFPRLLCHHPNTLVTVPMSSSAHLPSHPTQGSFSCWARADVYAPAPGQVKPVLERAGHKWYREPAPCGGAQSRETGNGYTCKGGSSGGLGEQGAMAWHPGGGLEARGAVGWACEMDGPGAQL